MLQQTSVPPWNRAAQPVFASTPARGPGGMTLGALPEFLTVRPTFLPHETEDTLLTGGTRSLNRRLLALNLERTLSRRPVTSQIFGPGMDSFERSA